MKINITIQPETLNGYTNLSPLKGDDIFNLQVENNSCTEIVAEILDYVPHTILPNVLANYATKLRHNGKLILGGTSANQVIKQLINELISLKDFNNKVYGTNEHPWDIKRSLCEISIVKQMLQQLGLKIDLQTLKDDKFTIIGVRP